MSVTVNEKGGNEMRVNLIKRGAGEIQHVMLNSTLINKAENYTLLTDRFVTNNLPGIMQHTRQLIEIRPRGPQGGQNNGFAAGAFLATRNTFTPRKTFSVGRLCEAMAQFFSHFNFGLYIYGANYSAFNNLNWYIAQQPQIAAGTPYDLRNNIPPDQVTQHVSLGFEADGSLQLVFSPQFLSNFFIVLDPVFAAQVGFPEQIYSGATALGVVVMSNQPGCLPLVAGGNFALPSQVNDGVSIISTSSIYRVDDRLSIDVEISLPVARTIDVQPEKKTTLVPRPQTAAQIAAHTPKIYDIIKQVVTREKQTYLLSRFVVTDYVKVETIAQQKGGFLLTKSLVQDKLGTGFTDLVANQPGTHASQLKNGKIRELDVRLALRYKDFEIINGILTYSIKTKTLELEPDGCYDLLLSFQKRV